MDDAPEDVIVAVLTGTSSVSEEPVKNQGIFLRQTFDFPVRSSLYFDR